MLTHSKFDEKKMKRGRLTPDTKTHLIRNYSQPSKITFRTNPPKKTHTHARTAHGRPEKRLVFQKESHAPKHLNKHSHAKMANPKSGRHTLLGTVPVN